MLFQLTHWGRVTHICVVNLTIIGPNNDLSPGRHQAIIWTNTGILSIGPWGTNFSEILVVIHTFPFKKIHLKMPSGKSRPCLSRPQCAKTQWRAWTSMEWIFIRSHFVWGVLTPFGGFDSSLLTRFMGNTWGPSGAERTQVGPMLAPWTLLSGTEVRLPQCLWCNPRRYG